MSRTKLINKHKNAKTKKGIVLAGGSGTRLYPLTKVVSKQLMPVYDKPMIYYPISILMMAGIKDILIITTPEELSKFKSLLGTGADWGVSFSYEVQAEPNGLAEAFIIAEDFIGDDSVCLVLGDNLFYGHDLTPQLTEAANAPFGATVFGYHVSNPQDYGVIEFDANRKAKKIIEKPTSPISNYAIPGLYFFNSDVVKISKSLLPSSRGELEIADVINTYLNNNDLNVLVMGRGTAWLDTGTHDSLLRAAEFIETVEKRQGLKICCPEEIAFRKGFITDSQLRSLAEPLKKSGYGQYLINLLKHDTF
ncbi:glucose-1-phosphate thymidylyltransferase RfbA [Shewanella goraebulensis]|uniref:glucose-1-phosphate thymidylyltransferase RfbA n=1 Tax=Shewanella goraebulensis TaxID=3050637 RepID=UPI002550295F|nr:glucose-1-phosphate thymidylyltransferase RfbA [Shewanella goraebulensis]